jgi:hypothetical protein
MGRARAGGGGVSLGQRRRGELRPAAVGASVLDGRRPVAMG